MQMYISPQKQAHIYATGLMAIIALGILGLIAVCLAAIWLVFQLAALLLASVVECCGLIGSLYASADPMIKFLLLVVIGYAIYRIARRAWRF